MKTRQQPIKLSEIGVGVPPSSDALWREPPPRSARRQTQYLDIANEMASRLGEWRLIGVFDGSTKSAQHFASTIRTHKGAWGNVANEEDGYFEATYTDVDEDGLRAVYARFVAYT